MGLWTHLVVAGVRALAVIRRGNTTDIRLMLLRRRRTLLANRRMAAIRMNTAVWGVVGGMW